MKEKASVLIVDDDISICKTMSLVLKREGYDVTVANSGLEAIERACEKSFDAIFMEMRMPLMHGVWIWKRIEKIRPEAVVVMMTAYREEIDNLFDESTDKPSYTYLQKPFDMEVVLKLVDKIRETKTRDRIAAVKGLFKEDREFSRLVAAEGCIRR